MLLALILVRRKTENQGSRADSLMLIYPCAKDYDTVDCR